MLYLLFILIIPFSFEQLTNAELKSNYETFFASENTLRNDALVAAGHQGDIYYFFPAIDGGLALFQAQGDIKHLNEVIEMIMGIFDVALPSNSFPNGNLPAYTSVEVLGFPHYDDSFLGWDNHGGRVTTQGSTDGGETSLYEGHGFRNIPKLLWVLAKSPKLRKISNGRGGTFQDDYDYIIDFYIKNIWNKWRDRGLNNFYRSRTHMASHWAQPGMYLYEIYKDSDAVKAAEYKEVYEKFNNDMSAYYVSSMREQLKPHPNRAGAYAWDNVWGGDSYADCSHANAEVAYMINGNELGIEWTDDDMDSIVLTLREILDNSPDDDFKNIPYRVNGVYNSADQNNALLHQGWSMLGRFDETLQQDLESLNSAQYTSSRYGALYWGNLAFNRAWLDGTIQYPESLYQSNTDDDDDDGELKLPEKIALIIGVVSGSIIFIIIVLVVIIGLTIYCLKKNKGSFGKEKFIEISSTEEFTAPALSRSEVLE